MTKIGSGLKDQAAETLRQARTFDRIKRHYEGLGLCGPCAAQAAWGHQIGFSQSKAPCEDCQPIVDGFPVAKPNGWRSNSPRRGVEFSPWIRREKAASEPLERES
ncbi:hypothetical protein SAMN05216555_10988 [Arthrobacter cupressi]|uniref:Uncharacterized protein n=1 Tax=Arthrobacter cupressi TaxID=1045773 RepID=A0A1G8SQ14_9MICC|nr:hypothetical protein [Arthrobacter cupressi]SDJ31264.1 hypothetical protein SAMN05216555_10988 [Arthrobacter cupressi]